jgi:hypothetical protein
MVKYLHVHTGVYGMQIFVTGSIGNIIENLRDAPRAAFLLACDAVPRAAPNPPSFRPASAQLPLSFRSDLSRSGKKIKKFEPLSAAENEQKKLASRASVR